MFEVITPELREQIAESLAIDIDQWSCESLNDGHRKHLGASLIGKPCSRELWYTFRWAKKATFSESDKDNNGRLFRLFDRGHREEPAMIRFLEGIGCKFKYTKEQQARISDCGGHFGGSLDNIGTLPERYGITQDILFEFKTSAFSEFNKLVKDRVKKHKPAHWAQMCAYGYKAHLHYGLYMCANKNNDELHLELLQLDHDFGKMMVERAHSIITSQIAPPKISMTPTNFSCKWCSFKDICHYGAPVEKNCRSCANAVPIDGGKWSCALYGEIPDEVIPQGCDQHTPLVNITI